MKYLIRDGKGTVYNTVENPAAVFDQDSGTLHRICEHEAAIEYFNQRNDRYRAHGHHDIADDLTYMELPKDQKEIDKVFQITGYIKKLHHSFFAHSH
ncbi:hypothetical protein RKD55_004581 [Rossellomorea marisflavi]